MRDPKKTVKDISSLSYSDVAELVKKGRKWDYDKARYDLFPWGLTEKTVDVMTFGAKKYDPNNWQKVDNGIERYFAAMMRHIIAWRNGEINDPESGLPHLAHANCCMNFIYWLEANNGRT